MGGEKWQAGITYLKVLLHALSQHHRKDVTVCLLASGNMSDGLEELNQIADEVLPMSAFRKRTVLRGINLVMKRALQRDWLGGSFLKQHKIDVVFGLCMQYRYNTIPTLSFVFDFQHVHMPEMFSLRERLWRDLTFFQTARLSTRIVVMTETVKRDFEVIFPKYAYKVRVLKTASYIPQSIYEVDPQSVTKHYKLPAKFIYVPNQFWKHKNHEIAFRAIELLKNKGLKVFVVCSGCQEDFRHPHYFSDLLHKISQWNIQDQVAFLGLVPRDHVFQLMRQSICVLNPSLFEGFGLTVDEGRSVGKQLLLSDIPAHREQNVPNAILFDPKNCQDLAQKLEWLWCKTLPGIDPELECEARQSLPGRVQACADSFMSVVREAYGQ